MGHTRPRRQIYYKRDPMEHGRIGRDPSLPAGEGLPGNSIKFPRVFGPVRKAHEGRKKRNHVMWVWSLIPFPFIQSTVDCKYCGSDAVVTCEKDGSTAVCDSHANACSKCGKKLCQTCIDKCQVCGGLFCDDDTTECWTTSCETCGDKICTNCGSECQHECWMRYECLSKYPDGKCLDQHD